MLCAWLAEESDAKRQEVCSVLPFLLELCGGRVHRCVLSRSLFVCGGT